MAKLDKKKVKEESFEKNIISENKFTDLKDLVKAPLLAVAESNIDLSKSIIRYIQSSGKEASVYDEKVMFLENINLGYQQMKQGDNNVQIIEDMALQVPLLSIMPITNLQVKNAKIDFNAEVRGSENSNHQIQYEARVCAPESRSTDYLSKIHFEIEVASSDATEGLARFIDVLNMHQIPKKIDVRPVDSTGNVLYGENEKKYQQQQQFNEDLRQVQISIEKTEAVIHQQKLNFNGALKSIDELSESNYENFVLNQTYKDIICNQKNRDQFSEIIKLYDDIQVNIDDLSKLMQRKQDIQQAILQLETKQVLDNER